MAAEEAVSEAFHKTCRYYAKLSNGQSKCVNEEHDIAERWDKAAIKLNEIDPALSMKLRLKSKFWREGAAWTEEEIALAKISFDDLRNNCGVVFPL
ncbi:hypothetical protein [Microbulbifer taiwanensis]|uniref:Uncharacterized protein n=1 Tax=Microbulbifer taiwanensis TaxID=986746 RepID=A0ABW1YTX6_9GAMM|nr:hypothetical protein [Microbulbifer taiwanensis]